MTGSRGPIIGVDVGGTKIATLLAHPDGTVIARLVRPTNAHEGPARVVENIFRSIEATAQQGGLPLKDVTGIGVAAAGVLDPRTGVIATSPNLPGWEGLALKAAVEDRTQRPTYVGNDASLAALGEHLYGAGRDAQDLIFMTVSTGIGGGIICNGELYEGASGSAGEIGHMVMDPSGPLCACGNLGCLEAFASGGAMARTAVRRMEEGEESLLRALSKGDLSAITGRIIFEAAEQKDALSLSLVAEAAYYLGLGVVNLLHLLNPSLILIGGGLSRSWEALIGPMLKVVRERAFQSTVKAVRVMPAGLGVDAGALGAVALVARKEGLIGR